MFMKLLLLVIFFPISIFCQISSGIVTYDVLVPYNEKLDVYFNQEYINNVNKLQFELKFNQNSSVFEVIDNKLSNHQNSKYLSSSAKAKGVFYKDSIESLLLSFKDDEEFGKLIIQVDNNVNWNIANVSKIISGYTCYMATSEIWFYNENFRSPTKIEAWFCPEIPALFGPKCFGGLPGLILELKNGDVVFSAAEIRLNPKERILIKKPTDGTLITNLEYKKLIDDFMDEMRPK